MEGKKVPVGVYEVLAHRSHAPDGVHGLGDAFGEALAAYRRQAWGEAIAVLERIAAGHPEDSPTRLYLERCRALGTAPSAFTKACEDSFAGIGSPLTALLTTARHDGLVGSGPRERAPGDSGGHLWSTGGLGTTLNAITEARLTRRLFLESRRGEGGLDLGVSILPASAIPVVVNFHTLCAWCGGRLLVKVQRRDTFHNQRYRVDLDVEVFPVCPTCRKQDVDEVFHTVLTDLVEGTSRLVLIDGGGRGDRRPRGHLRLVRRTRKP